ncbi:hypothetical protein [Gilliamella sp. ESL0254]|uniref:hypothetical protein n=1 Tax=Gilliamella sp. ESL0254 TaxID=2705035 RepID=UPI001580AC19|nr:hypothetical protein [Gilliamella sp. ESL0254]NUF27286.1 hypothetical protein [Gilliamella sp. ESL0254]
MASGIWHLACQTYALNLFQFHRSPKKTQFSFLSPKLSKSSSLALPQRPSFLSYLSKSPLAFAPLLLLSYSQSSQALTAQTSQVIRGSAPYFTYDGGRTRATTTDDLLTITLPNGTRVTPSINTTSAGNPIMLPAGSTFSDIRTFVPSPNFASDLDTIVRAYQNWWGDDDGDGQGTYNVTATGRLSISIIDRYGNNVNYLSNRLLPCWGPYKMTLSVTNGSLKTRYGLPNRSDFPSGTATYYISSGAEICSVMPNLFYGGTGRIMGDSPQDTGHIGPAWDPKKGFKDRPSTNPTLYSQNFPTTGADRLYFDLDIGGMDGSQLTWSPVSHDGITATVTWGRYSDNWLINSQPVTRVMLNGPKASTSQINTTSPSSLNAPSLPHTFELEGRDRSGNVMIKYGFVLKQWFVNRNNRAATQPEHSSWCSRLGYRLPKIKDLTNHRCGITSAFPCYGGINGATPWGSKGFYMRHIGAGFFSEWGRMSDYVGANFVDSFYYWTDDVINGSGFHVTLGGTVRKERTSYNYYGLCTTP